MTQYTTNATHEQVAARIRGARNIALITHSKPDGDAMGCILALSRACDALKIASSAYLMGPVQPNLLMLAGDVDLIRLDDEDNSPRDDHDLIIVCDTGALSQLDPIAGWLTARLDSIIVLDHHINGNLVASMRIVDAGAASASMIVQDLLPPLGVKPTGGPFGIAEALLLGLATDTGWFRYSNAGPRAFRAGAALLEAGADKGRIFAIVEENDRPERLAIKARALQSLEIMGSGRAALMSLTPEDFDATGATVEDLVAIVNEPMSIGSVRVSVLLSSTEGGVTKVSLRSKPPMESNNGRVRAIDVNRVAMQFGGGGHIHAAGARVAGPIEEVRDKVRAALEREFSGDPPL